MIKSFRGKIANDTEERIRLSTNNGLTGYRITKFQIISEDPNDATIKFVTKVSKSSVGSTAINDAVDFSDPNLLAVGSYNEAPGGQDQAGYGLIIFDNMVFNQDIFITHLDAGAENKAANYYLELEQMKLDLGEATVATLKDMRGRE